MASKISSRNNTAIPHNPSKRPREVKERKVAPGSSVRDLLLSIAEMGEQIPADVRAKIPRDFAKNIDHYLYGHPKVD